MLFKNAKKFKYNDILVPIFVFLLLVGLLFLVMNSLQIVTQTNKNNFLYTIKIRNTVEEIDKIVERAEVNLNVITDIIIETYDVHKLYNQEYNIEYSRKIERLMRATLINSPGVDGAWYQLNANMPFANKVFAWYEIHNGKIINLKDKLEKMDLSERTLTPEEDPYYFEAVKNKKLAWSDVYTDADTKLSLVTLSQPIYKNGTLIGVVGIDISIKNLQLALKNMQKQFEGSEIYLLDKNNKLILSQLQNNEKISKDQLGFIDLFKNKNTHKEAMVEFNENLMHKTAIILALSNKYNVVITFPNSIVFNGFDRLFKTIYFILFSLSVVALLNLHNRYKMIRMNRKLENEKNKLRSIIDSSPNVVIVKSLDGVYADCNKKFLELSGLEKKDFIGKTDYDLFSKTETEEILKNDKIVIETKEILVQETYMSNINGEKYYVEKYLVPLLDLNKNVLGLFILAIDRTKRKEEQDYLEKAKDDAEKATAMKSNFLANMSHEIRTPMNGVLGFIQLLKETNLTLEQEDFIMNAQKSSEMLLDIINDVLDFSKIEADKLQIDNTSFDIRSVVEDVTLLGASNARRKGLDVSSLICSDVPLKVFGDPGRVKQILNNLVGNAIKFTNEGEVVIYVNQISEDKDSALLSFKVKDTGIGIEEDKLNVIFQAFTQADASMTRKFGGTGLGLSISNKLADLMNGSIHVESKINEGSAFTLTLPFVKDKSIGNELNSSITSLSGARILVVDSNPTSTKIIDYYLNEANCTIYNAYSAEEALNIINQENQNMSVILIDCKMQDMGENELSYLIKQNEFSKDVPLILYTSLAKRGDAILAKEKGFSGYITKPIKKNELIEIIATAVNEKKENTQAQFVTKHFIKEYKFNSRAKILIVEDSEINCKLILKILNNHGLFPDLVFNGKEAIEAFMSKKYDLILMDCQMPILDGYEATKAIRKLEEDSKRVPIIAMTANALSKDEDKCYEVGMDDYVSKPINVDELLSLIGKYLKFEAALAEESNDISINNFDDINESINKMIDELGFDRNTAVEFFTDYLKFLPESILELKKMAEENNFEELKKLAHKIKGSSSNLRIEKITQLSIMLEKEASNENKEACLSLISEIKNHLDNLNALFLKFVYV